MSNAQDIDRIITQEKHLRFARFGEMEAWRLGSQMREAAAARSLPVVIDIRLANRQLFYAALPGSDADNPEWVRRKSNVVLRYAKSSYRFGRELALKGERLSEERGVTLMDYAPHGGSFPIHVEGTGVVGAITVSGLPQREDHNFVIEHLCAFLDGQLKDIALAPEQGA
jgi:uncharacterized protein (UPF0303 family)